MLHPVWQEQQYGSLVVFPLLTNEAHHIRETVLHVMRIWECRLFLYLSLRVLQYRSPSDSPCGCPSVSLTMEEGFESVKDVICWLEEKGFSEDVVDAFKGMRAWIIVNAYSMSV